MRLGFAARQGHAEARGGGFDVAARFEAKNNVATLHAQRGDVEKALSIWEDLAHGGGLRNYIA